MSDPATLTPDGRRALLIDADDPKWPDCCTVEGMEQVWQLTFQRVYPLSSFTPVWSDEEEREAAQRVMAAVRSAGYDARDFILWCVLSWAALRLNWIRPYPPPTWPNINFIARNCATLLYRWVASPEPIAYEATLGVADVEAFIDTSWRSSPDGGQHLLKIAHRDPLQFERVVAYIGEHGYEDKFRGRTYRYLDVGRYTYWTRDLPLPSVKTIYRRKTADLRQEAAE